MRARTRATGTTRPWIAQYDEPAAQAALAKIACDPENDEDLLDTVSESLAGIWARQQRWGFPLRLWFGMRKRARDGITEAEFDAAVDLAMRRLPEVERYFATGRSSWRM